METDGSPPEFPCYLVCVHCEADPSSKLGLVCLRRQYKDISYCVCPTFRTWAVLERPNVPATNLQLDIVQTTVDCVWYGQRTKRAKIRQTKLIPTCASFICLGRRFSLDANAEAFTRAKTCRSYQNSGLFDDDKSSSFVPNLSKSLSAISFYEPFVWITLKHEHKY
jgi:hypothetical protein